MLLIKINRRVIGKIMRSNNYLAKNLYYAQKFQKQAHNKSVKPRSYDFSDKVWFNSKYIKTQQNQKLEVKFFKPLQILYFIGKQTYKLKLPKKWTIHNICHMSLLEQNTTTKKWVDKNMIEFEIGNSKKYKMKAIWDIVVYINKAKVYLLGLYYLIAWKNI